ncbi:acylphosphatase [Maritimibacter sp. 55A14]|uniref:acylphosphatase n=1 Tax=Maritimibacter sp. 55A14 TaxID=2174844 RepID=UPI000D61B4C0|nr:acylphosphatase [Maritimibacter sp. 55A14]PWE33280.1 acylphosphatase [Maritimibacter sp. 55A14]
MEKDCVAIRTRITGRVQGVSFRAWARGQAEAHGLTGWVRNEDDGSVLAFLQGRKADVAAMVHALDEGPGAAVVQNIETEEAEPSDGLRSFDITG